MVRRRPRRPVATGQPGAKADGLPCYGGVVASRFDRQHDRDDCTHGEEEYFGRHCSRSLLLFARPSIRLPAITGSYTWSNLTQSASGKRV